MKKKISIMVSALAVALLTLSAPAVFAKQPIDVYSTGNVTLVPIPVKFAGGNVFMEVVGNGIYTGDFEGTTIGYHNWHVNKDGSINMKIDLVFTGTVLGKSGTLNMVLTGIMKESGAKMTWTIISGTDELANLRGTGTLGVGWISGQVHFDP